MAEMVICLLVTIATTLGAAGRAAWLLSTLPRTVVDILGAVADIFGVVTDILGTVVDILGAVTNIPEAVMDFLGADADILGAVVAQPLAHPAATASHTALPLVTAIAVVTEGEFVLFLRDKHRVVFALAVHTDKRLAVLETGLEIVVAMKISAEHLAVVIKGHAALAVLEYAHHPRVGFYPYPVQEELVQVVYQRFIVALKCEQHLQKELRRLVLTVIFGIEGVGLTPLVILVDATQHIQGVGVAGKRLFHIVARVAVVWTLPAATVIEEETQRVSVIIPALAVGGIDAGGIGPSTVLEIRIKLCLTHFFSLLVMARQKSVLFCTHYSFFISTFVTH